MIGGASKFSGYKIMFYRHCDSVNLSLINHQPNEIRHGYSRKGHHLQRNVVDGSDSPENGKREIALWFKEGELADWTPVQAPWLIE